MSADETQKEFLGFEYDKLKSEQTQRIGFRDNMLFVHLAAVGGVASWVLTNLDKSNVVYALLVIPWLCLILGWTYIVNDHAVSRIGKYVRLVVDKRASKIASLEPVKVIEDDEERVVITDVFGWETFHRTDKRRESRKWLQCVADITTFVMPGGLAIWGFWLLQKWKIECWLLGVIGIEGLLLAGLLAIIIQYSDFKRGTESKPMPTRAT